MNNIDSVFSSYGLVDTNKVAGEESPSQASGLRETKEGENPSKPNNTHNGLGKDKLSISSGCTDVLPSKPNKNIKDEVLIR